MTELAPRSLALLGISIPVLRTPREQWDTIVLSEGKRVREKACPEQRWQGGAARREGRTAESEKGLGKESRGQHRLARRSRGSRSWTLVSACGPQTQRGLPGAVCHTSRAGRLQGVTEARPSSVDWSQEEVPRAPSGRTQEPLCDLGGGESPLAGSHPSQKWWLGSDSGLLLVDVITSKIHLNHNNHFPRKKVMWIKPTDYVWIQFFKQYELLTAYIILYMSRTDLALIYFEKLFWDSKVRKKTWSFDLKKWEQVNITTY